MPAPSLKPLPPRRILIVNSRRGSANELVAQLSKAGHTVEIAYDGPGALDAEATFRPDIVIIDLDLAGMDALALARSLRAQASRNLLLVADEFVEEDYARAEQAGCFDDYVSRFGCMIVLRSAGMKLANEPPEYWVRVFDSLPKVDFLIGMLAGAAEQFEPAELAPFAPNELLGEVRRLAESPADLRNYSPDFDLKITDLDEYREKAFRGASRWLQFFRT